MRKAVEAKEYLLGIDLRRDKVPSFDRYPFSLPAVRNLSRIEFTRPVTFFIGENGAGKSTLIEAIAMAAGFNPEGGSRNFRFTTRESHSELHQFIHATKGIRRPKDGYFLRAESFFNVASEVDRLDVSKYYGGRSLHAQSHGESFMTLLMDRLQGHGLYIFDEPEAALSPTRQMAMLSRMHDLVKNESQFIIATHSPIIMSYPAATILLLEGSDIREIAYEDTEHFVITREFLNNHRKLLRELLEAP